MAEIYTRAQYIVAPYDSGEAFRRYYGGIIEACGGAKAFAPYLPFSLEQIRAAIAAGDVYLNTLKLHAWDMARYPASLPVALKERGDWLSLGNKVCVLKEAARILAQEIN